VNLYGIADRLRRSINQITALRIHFSDGENTAGGIEKGNVQRHERIFHPDGKRHGFRQHEQHAAIRRQIFTSGETAPPRFGSGGNFKIQLNAINIYVYTGRLQGAGTYQRGVRQYIENYYRCA